VTSPATVARLVKRLAAPQPRIGFVTAVDLGQQLVTVAFEDGSTTSSLSWASSSYTSPTVGDRVLVIPTSTGWVVSSKVTPRPVLIPDQQVTARPTKNWQGNVGDWAGAYWSWYDYLTLSDPNFDAWQGKVPPQQGGDGYVQTDWDTTASALSWGSLAALVPSGATISQVTLTLRADWVQQDLVAPVLYGHALTSTPADGTAPAPVAGYGPLRFPRMALGDVQTITLPATWVTAWLAGTITGLMLYSTTQADGARFGDAWHVSADRMSVIWDTRINATLGITYSGGTT
jgi:hypothetical protein